jgi:outer membrane protein TolC
MRYFALWLGAGLWLSAATVQAAAPRAAAPPDNRPLTLETALAEALAANPALAEARARAAAAAEIPPQAGSLPDPRLTIGYLNVPADTYRLDQEPMTQQSVGLAQEFPTFGKRGLRRAAAEHEAAAAAHMAEETRLRIAREVAVAWWGLVYLDRALAIVARNLALLDELVDIAEAKYRVGRGLQQDVLLAQLERSRLIEMRLGLEGRRRAQEADLNRLLGRPVAQPIVLPAAVGEALPPLEPEEAVQARALAQRPLLAARLAEIEAARARYALARRDYAPNVTVSAAYGVREGRNPDGSERPDFATLQLSLNLPLYAASRQARAVDQRAAEIAARERALEDTRAQVLAEIARAAADYRRAQAQVELFRRGILPQAEQTVHAMLAAYQVDKVDFLNLVRARLTHYNAQLQYWQALTEAKQARAALAAAAGEEPPHE